MCGIAGILNTSDPDQPISEHAIKNMLALIRHRGPDETGIYLGNNIGMGNVRLSIIDLKSGQQPICDESQNFWIVYNGEIFNYPELRKELEKEGVRFYTNSDTEVVVQAYAQYGPACLQKFNGQFAFAIWDKKKNELFLARDRVGIRPLFYTNHSGSFYFCSEIKGIFQNSSIPRTLSHEALAQVFTFWTTITPNTPYEGVYELPPGHFMLVRSGEQVIKRYWDYNFPENPLQASLSDVEAMENLDEILHDAVRIRLRADVPVAAYLSGGIDSSATTSYIKSIEPDVLNTFSIGFNDAIFDESNYQNLASDYFQTKHKAYSCSSDEIAENFVNTVWHTEYPLLRTAPTPMYLLSKLVRANNIKVVITGEGADEMLAGYNIFKEAKVRRFWANAPHSESRPRLLEKLYPYLPHLQKANGNMLKCFFGYQLEDTSNPIYSHILRWHNTSRIRNYFSADIKNKLQDYNPVQELVQKLGSGFSDMGELAKAQYLESTIFMSGYLLSSQGDRMAMANSVEGRYPFLDHRLIDFCTSLPDRLKLNGLNEKFLLKKLMQNRIPDSILNRNKQAYRAPISKNLMEIKPGSLNHHLMSEKMLKTSAVFDLEKVKRLSSKISIGKNISEVDNMALAGILSTQLIHSLFIAKLNPPTKISQEFEINKIIRDGNQSQG